MSGERFLPAIAAALADVQNEGDSISTLSMVKLFEKILMVFDHLGPVLLFAKQDMYSKCESLKQAAATHATLKQMVEADKAAGVVTKKNSCGRNLHRLNAVLTFMRLLLFKLLEDANISIKDAASFAYQQALSPIHPYVVRTAVWAGMYVLPSRQVFMTSIGETEESAREPSTTFTNGAEAVEAAILALYDEPMPASDVAPTSMFTTASWWGGSATAKADAATEVGTSAPITSTQPL
ncbi:hypothetical protein CEUSTIGMA_g3149.t1 [Chlamydomonas eustigma]|uniref:Glycolipid transfer protein domain-containing protein n=1 Tax=Chlamydomonas eustigma TaxID=1157962 RepID=A0A250WY47_9CHLO|nr:hypothetical protein CEUSTIGMA_g3149.t1 [Chlamydomonas eustigma]|eukprot:GAX75706.1 hypothetical protein CEUSTIGMA_g3149.t1 [Chlamydomonas eustigma]